MSMKKVTNKKCKSTRDFACMRRALIPRNRSGQVWIETVIYTLIAFVMMGLILSYAKPKIEEIQDNALLKQSTEMLKEIDSTILTMGAAGNQRILEIGIKKGTLTIDSAGDKIIFEMDSQSIYSEPNRIIKDGSVEVYTVKKSGYNTVTLTLNYDTKYNLQFNGEDKEKVISKASTPYKLLISNDGVPVGQVETVMNIKLN
jgi:hypothetical protein